MCDVDVPVLDAPAKPVAGSLIDGDSTLLFLHQEVLETIRITIGRCAHPGCFSCHELAAVLDRYLIG